MQLHRIQRVLVTGAAGYIGSVLVRALLERGYTVYGFDRLLFGDHAIQGLYGHPRFRFVRGDIRNPDEYASLVEGGEGVESVVHLAALVGDPACMQAPELAEETNLHASVQLFDACCASPTVRRFVFASTCSNYGRAEGIEYFSEDSALRPLSLYARTKVAVERHVLESEEGARLIPVVLRFATAYGSSPRMRFDLTVNEFTLEVALGRVLQIYGKDFWRPYCHTSDIARACVSVLEAESDLVDHRAFNVGDTTENYTKERLAEILREFRPDANIEFVAKDEDPRDYKVSFERIRQTLDFTATVKVRDGIREIFEMLKSSLPASPDARIFRNAS